MSPSDPPKKRGRPPGVPNRKAIDPVFGTFSTCTFALPDYIKVGEHVFTVKQWMDMHALPPCLVRRKRVTFLPQIK